jgi:hypothetical protein
VIAGGGRSKALKEIQLQLIGLAEEAGGVAGEVLIGAVGEEEGNAFDKVSAVARREGGELFGGGLGNEETEIGAPSAKSDCYPRAGIVMPKGCYPMAFVLG